MAFAVMKQEGLPAATITLVLADRARPGRAFVRDALDAGAKAIRDAAAGAA